MPKSLKKLQDEYVKANTSSAVSIIKVPPMTVKVQQQYLDNKSTENSTRTGWTKTFKLKEKPLDLFEVKLAKQVLG